MRMIAVLVLVLLAVLAPSSTLATERRDRFDHYSVLPFVELQPGFTTAPRQRFVLDLGGIGREPIKVLIVAVNDRALPRGAWSARLNQLAIVPDRDLRVGLNHITITYTHPLDRAHRIHDNPVVHTFFVNHQRRRAQVKFGDRGELLVDGTPRFIRAGYRSGQADGFADALPSAVEAGFDMVHDYRFESYNLKELGLEKFIQEARVYLRRAHELGLGVFLGLPRAAVTDYDERALATMIGELANEPALWMWYIYDEPRADVLSVEVASRVYGLFRRLDPSRPSIMLVNRVPALLQYHPFCDVLWYDRYPIVATSDELTSLAPIAASVQVAMQSVAPGKPVWPVLQVQDNKGSPSLRKRVPTLPMPSDRTHRPNEAEIRAQTHVAIAQGVMAVVYYWAPERWYSMRTDTPGIWRSVSGVLRELGTLEPVLLSNEPVPTIEVTRGHDKAMMWSRSHEGQIYVGLVNASVHTPAELALQLPLNGASVRKVLGDGRIEVMGDRVDVSLGAAGVAVLAFRSPR